MRKTIVRLGACALVCALANLLHAQSRSLGAKAIILDDGAGHEITIITPTGGWTGNISYQLPIPPNNAAASGFTYSGTSAGQLLTWVAPNTTGPAPNNYAGGPQGSWQPISLSALGGISGAGTTNTIPIWTSASTQGNSHLTDNATTLSYSGTHINSSSDYQIGGTTILAAPGSANIFAGAGAGTSNTSGFNNTFMGAGTGQSNTSGIQNTIVGAASGEVVVSGNNNSFFGSGSGWVTTGSQNTFLGTQAGWTNTSGNSNTAVGDYADVGSATLTNATAIGAGAIVAASNTVQLGSSSVTLVNTNGNLNVGGHYEIGGTTILAAPGSANIFAGAGAGTSNTSGFNNTFMGAGTGQSNTSGIQNTIVGAASGEVVVSGNNNSFFGSGSGWVTTGSQNTFLGTQAGWTNTSGNSNTAVGDYADVGSGALTNATAIGAGAIVAASNTVQLGNSSVTLVNTNGNLNVGSNYQIGGTTILAAPGSANIFAGAGAGTSNTSGFNNTFMGAGTGQSNTSGIQNTIVGAASGEVVVSGNNNSFFGAGSGWVTTGSQNTFLGTQSGWTNTSGSSNTAVGDFADVGSGALTNATAIGAGAVVAASNTVQLGNSSVTSVNTAGSYVAAKDVQVGRNLIVNSESIAAGGTLDGLANIYEITSGATTTTAAPSSTTPQTIYVHNSSGNTQTVAGTSVANGKTATMVYFPTSGWIVTSVF